MPRPYHERLAIPRPSLAELAAHREASAYSLLLIALIEKGEPMTLEEAARKFEEAGIAPAPVALLSLKRCRPGRPPIYRHGDLYDLDVHDDELDLWLFRLGLRGPLVPDLRLVRKEPDPLPGPDVRLTPVEIERAFRGQHLGVWSAQRLAIAILDSQGGPMRGSEVVALLNVMKAQHSLRVESAQYWRAMAIAIDADGVWTLVPDHPAVRGARKAVRDQIVRVRRWESQGLDPASMAAHRKRIDELMAAQAAELARLRRALLIGFPAEDPVAVTIIDVTARDMKSCILEGDRGAADRFGEVRERLARYDFIAGPGVRILLDRIGFDPGDRRLADLNPPQKSLTLNRWGRTLKITPELLVQGSCGISRPFGEPEKMRTYLRESQSGRFLRRLEADAKSWFALYQYGMLHGACRLRWGFLDEMFHVSWKHREEPGLFTIKMDAGRLGQTLEVVVGSAPGWENPWSRAILCRVATGDQPWECLLVDEEGYVVDDRDVQMVRVWGA